MHITATSTWKFAGNRLSDNQELVLLFIPRCPPNNDISILHQILVCLLSLNIYNTVLDIAVLPSISQVKLLYLAK